MEKDILKIVETLFDETISSSSSETALGLESWIEGKDDFLKELSIKLKNSGFYIESDLRDAFKAGKIKGEFPSFMQGELDEDEYIESIKN